MSATFESILNRQARTGRAGALTLVLGDQLDRGARAIRCLDRDRDVVLMAEVEEEARHVPSHLQRTTLFLSAMRHFARDLIERGYRVRYVRLDDRLNTQTLETELARGIHDLAPERVLVTTPGDHRVRQAIERTCRATETRLEVMPDETFTCSLDDFDQWVGGRVRLVMEHFYRERRRELDLLLKDGKPIGGRWNLDDVNREAFRVAPRIRRPYDPAPT